MKKIFLFIFSLFIIPLCVYAESIDINSASLADLDKLTGIGQTYAQRIIENRPYASVDDLVRVKGIGPATLQKIKEQGWACVYCNTSPQLPTINPSTTTIPTSSTTPPPATTPTTPPPTNSTPTTPIPTLDSTGVYINELLPMPEGADETDEWIELYNANDVTINLAQWSIQDTLGTTTTYTLTDTLPPHGYLVLKRPQTHITLNDSEDTLVLLQPNGTIVHSVSYPKAIKNQSYNRSDDGWFWSLRLTPGAVNNIQKVSSAPKNTLSKEKKSVNTLNMVASVSNAIPLSTSPEHTSIFSEPRYLFLSLAGLIIILGTGIAFWKITYKS